jgi:replication factor A1
VEKRRVVKGQMAKQIWRGRGRPLNRMPSYKDGRILESLARIALLHKVDSNEFFNRIVEAWNHDGSECSELAIKCRKKTKYSAIFLFTDGQKQARKVIAQFPISIAILQGQNQLERYTEAILARNSFKNLEGVTSKIGNLKVGMKRVSLKAEVLEIPESKIVYTRYGTTASISNAVIEDETGSMKMSLWNQQISMVHKGDVVDIKNGKVTWFSGERQLRLGRTGSLSIIECPRTVKKEEVVLDAED